MTTLKVTPTHSDGLEMYVRYLGNGVCWTDEKTGKFYIGLLDELTDEEKKCVMLAAGS